MSDPNSNQSKLNLYIHQLHQRLRLGASLRGVAILTATALITTIFLVLILNAFAFPVRGLTGARSLLLIALAVGCGPCSGASLAASHAPPRHRGRRVGLS